MKEEPVGNQKHCLSDMISSEDKTRQESSFMQFSLTCQGYEYYNRLIVRQFVREIQGYY